MKSSLVPLLCGLSLLGSSLLQAAPYDARIREKEVLTPAPALAPRINGPTIYGARPGKQFLYRIPTQGERPMQFSVQGLPDGLSLNPAEGIITGRTPHAPGTHAMTFVAQNAHGKTGQIFKLVVGEKLALTPPTGWNSWGGQMVNVDDTTVRKAADLFVQRGLADAGFQYIGIDDCWMRLTQSMYDSRDKNVVKKHASYDYHQTGTIGPIRDESGNILPNGKFPDMKALTDYIHSKGLKAGIYSTPGIRTCQGWAGSYGHEQADADQYAQWGFDLLKYDQCSGGVPLKRFKQETPGFQTKDFWQPMSRFLRVQDRDIFYNLCQYGLDDPWTWAPAIGIQTWRTGGDLNHHVDHYFINGLRIATELRQFNKPGQWNDPDFLYIHRIRDVRRMGEPSEEIPLTTNQRYQYVTLWAIICAPFFFSCDIEHIDEFTIRLLSNAGVMAITQDELGHTAEVIRHDDKAETVMLKKLADGSRALAIFNRQATAEAVLTVNWPEIGLAGSPKVVDVWRQKNLGPMGSGISVQLSPHGVGLFLVGP